MIRVPRKVLWIAVLLVGCATPAATSAPAQRDDLADAFDRQRAIDAEDQRRAEAARNAAAAEANEQRRAHDADCASDREERLRPPLPPASPAVVDDPKLIALRAYIREHCSKTTVQATETHEDATTEDGTATTVGRLTVTFYQCPPNGPDGARGQVLWPEVPRPELRVARIVQKNPEEDYPRRQQLERRASECRDSDSRSAR